jgi:hypothetical protein
VNDEEYINNIEELVEKIQSEKLEEEKYHNEQNVFQ